MSILTFNMSVSNKSDVSETKCPFQIMPSTTNYLSDHMIENYITTKNPNILIHMNYITRPFTENSVMKMSKVRNGLAQYVKLAKKLGTQNILIHMPETLNEWNNIAHGFKIIHEEIINKDMHIHMEIPSFSKDLLAQFNPDLNKDPKEYISLYVDTVCKYLDAFPNGSSYIVPDTAHLFADGIETIEDFKYILDKYKDRIKYIHFNGNINYKFKSDTHCPIFGKMDKIKCWEELSSLCASLNKICVTENTKFTCKWETWEAYAKKYDFKLVPFNESYCL